MTGIKRAREELCPLCNSNIKIFDLNADKALTMCVNSECVYPFDQPDVEGLIIELPHNDMRYSKKQKTPSSSLANSTQPLKAVDDDSDSVKSAEELSLDDFDTSSFATQTDELISIANVEETLLPDDVTNITQVAPASSAAAATTAATTTTSHAANDSSNAPSNFSLQDIEFLLTDNNTGFATASTATSPSMDVSQSTVSVECTSPTSPTSPSVYTPKDDTNLNWIEDLDVIFGDAMSKTDFNPLAGDSEFDSMLGI